MNSSQRVVIIILFVIVAGVIGMYFVSKRQQEQRFSAARRTADEFHHSVGGRDEAIAKMREALAYAPSDKATASTKSKLAYDLISRNEGLDRSEGVQLLKSVWTDQALSQRRRAGALGELAFNLWKIGSEANAEFARKYVFNDEPFASYLREAGEDVYWAISRMFQAADAVYPNAQAKIMTAFMHVQRLLSNRIAPGMTREGTAQWSQQLLQDGLALFEDKNFTYENGRLAFLYLQYAKTLDWSDIVLHNIPVDSIRVAYERSVETGKSAPNDVHSQVALLEARYYYAIFLTNRFGADEVEAVEALLKPVISARGLQFDFFHQYIRNVFSRLPETYVRSQLVKIAGISPLFRSYLIENGWKFQEG